MGQTADQIRDEIDNQRQELGDNLQQLEQKVKETVDWKSQFEQHPMLGVGVAFGAGLLVSALMPGGGKGDSNSKNNNAQQQYGGTYQYQPYASYSSEQMGASPSDLQSASEYRAELRQGQRQPGQQGQHKQRAPEMNEITETIDNIKGALLGLGARQLRTFLADSVPGFKDEYEQARQKRNASPDSQLDTSSSQGMSSSRDSSSGMRLSSGGGSAGMSSSGTDAPRTHDSQSSYHPDLNTQTPGLDPAASRAAATPPSADAFSGSGSSTSSSSSS